MALNRQAALRIASDDSTQTLTHASQMFDCRPAISLRISACAFRKKSNEAVDSGPRDHPRKQAVS
jgi:hypothetical protein